jgi:hypothetical protein
MPLAPFSHVESTKARWAGYEGRHGAGFTERHRKLYDAEIRSAWANDAVRQGNDRAEADLRAAGGDKDRALALAFARIDAGFAVGKPAQAKAA